MTGETSYRARYHASATYRRARRREFWQGIAPLFYLGAIGFIACFMFLSAACE